jgi:hypothetical protein
MDDKTRIENLTRAVALLLPLAEAHQSQLEVEARTKYVLIDAAEKAKSEIERAKTLAQNQ